MLSTLAHLHGGIGVLEEARQLFAAAPVSLHKALDELEQLATQLSSVPMHFDLAESRGYSYHTGVIFAAYVPKQGQAIAKGGRYDISETLFGCPRPATGFSTNLRILISLDSEAPSSKPTGIFAPAPDDPINISSLNFTIQQLRQAGEVVICGLPNQSGNAKAMGCDRELRLVDNQWQVIKL